MVKFQNKIIQMHRTRVSGIIDKVDGQWKAIVQNDISCVTQLFRQTNQGQLLVICVM